MIERGHSDVTQWGSFYKHPPPLSWANTVELILIELRFLTCFLWSKEGQEGEWEGGNDHEVRKERTRVLFQLCGVLAFPLNSICCWSDSPVLPWCSLWREAVACCRSGPCLSLSLSQGPRVTKPLATTWGSLLCRVLVTLLSASRALTQWQLSLHHDIYLGGLG